MEVQGKFHTSAIIGEEGKQQENIVLISFSCYSLVIHGHILPHVVAILLLMFSEQTNLTIGD
jgi:hypothetical protein